MDADHLPVAEDTLDEQDGRLLGPATGVALTGAAAQQLRDADQR